MTCAAIHIASVLLAQLAWEAAAGLRGDTVQGIPDSTVHQASGALHGSFVLTKRFNLAAGPLVDFDVINVPDQALTHSCANYINDGSTVFSRDGSLVLKVSSHCEGGGCMNSGRVMSKESFKYGLFTFSARVPKCNHVWPALWLLPANTDGEGSYGRWPCSGEIDVLETVHDEGFGTFNLVAGYGSSGGCAPMATTMCNKCLPGYCTSTTFVPNAHPDRYFVQATSCDAAHPSWEEHVFVMNWQADELTVWVDPSFDYDAQGRIVAVTPRAPPAGSSGMPSWKTYRRQSTPTWLAVEHYMKMCFPDKAQADAPFDDGLKIVLNLAVGGYGGAPCYWGQDACQTKCGGAVGSELIVSDISVWARAA